MLELEKKILLTEEEYATLVMIMHNYTSLKLQVNYYFDTDNFAMNNKGITCRIRAKDGKFKATIKSHDPKNTYFSVENTLWVKDEFDPNAFQDLGLHLQGSLTTKRIIAFKDDFCEMVLDRNTYLGFEDFELEIEYLEGHEERAENLLKNIAETLLVTRLISNTDEIFSREGKAKNKSQRFFERRLQIEGS